MEQQDNIINVIIDSLQDIKGRDIVVADLDGIENASVQNFIVCTANSTTQLSALADNVRERLRVDLGIKPYAYDGYQNAQWIVIDYGHVYVHIFLEEVREFYKLEQLWSDAKLTEVPNLD